MDSCWSSVRTQRAKFVDLICDLFQAGGGDGLLLLFEMISRDLWEESLWRDRMEKWNDDNNRNGGIFKSKQKKWIVTINEFKLWIIFVRKRNTWTFTVWSICNCYHSAQFTEYIFIIIIISNNIDFIILFIVCTGSICIAWCAQSVIARMRSQPFL